MARSVSAPPAPASTAATAPGRTIAAADAGSVTIAAVGGYGNFGAGGTLSLSAILPVTLSASGQFEQGHLYPLQLGSQGRPIPGGEATAFVTQLSRSDFGSTAARISAAGAIQSP